MGTEQQYPQLVGLVRLPGRLREFGGELPLARASAAKILRRQLDPYTTIEVPKRDGSKRHISSPYGTLKSFQSLILEKFLSGPEVAHSAAFAFVKGKSAIQCARVHEHASWALKVDLKNFFESIDERQVYWAFRSRGVSDYKSFFLARFTTRLEMLPIEVKKSLREYFAANQTPDVRKLSKVRRHGLSTKFGVQRRRLGYVPQGSPTSGQISNLVFYPLDLKLSKLAKGIDAKFTRYADDIIFSFRGDFSRDRAEKALKDIAQIIHGGGFTLNNSKTRILKPGTRMQVLGVLIGGSGLRIPPDKKKSLDKSLRAIRKFGFEKHAEFLGETNPYSLVNKLHGYLVWASEVEPTWAYPRLGELGELVKVQLED